VLAVYSRRLRCACLCAPRFPSTRSFFFFHGPAPTEIYTLSLHDALPIYGFGSDREFSELPRPYLPVAEVQRAQRLHCRAECEARSEEHTSELQSRFDLVCRLLLEKKKNEQRHPNTLK